MKIVEKYENRLLMNLKQFEKTLKKINETPEYVVQNRIQSKTNIFYQNIKKINVGGKDIFILSNYDNTKFRFVLECPATVLKFSNEINYFG